MASVGGAAGGSLATGLAGVVPGAPPVPVACSGAVCAARVEADFGARAGFLAAPLAVLAVVVAAPLAVPAAVVAAPFAVRFGALGAGAVAVPVASGAPATSGACGAVPFAAFGRFGAAA